MGNTTFKSNPKAFADMAVGPEVRAIVVAVAEKAKSEAEGLAQSFRVTGEYASSFEVTSETVTLDTRAGSHPVAAGVLTNTSRHAAAVEWGNAHNHKAHRVLGKTLDRLRAT